MDLNKEQRQKVQAIKNAIKIAEELFPRCGAPAVIFGEVEVGLLEFVFDSDDPKECHEQLRESLRIAEEIFKDTSPKVVFGVFGYVFEDEDEDEED